MATDITLAVDLDGPTWTSWSPSGGTVPQVVATNDGDTSYMTCTTAGASIYQSYRLEARPILAAYNSNNHVVRVRVIAGTPTWLSVQWLMGGSAGTAQNHTGLSTSYGTFQNATLARPGGGPWAVADWNESDNVIEMGATANYPSRNYRLTWAYATINVELPGAGSVVMMLQWIPALLGASLGTLSAREWTAVREEWANRQPPQRPRSGAFRFDEPDWRRFVESLRAYRWPKTFCLVSA